MIGTIAPIVFIILAAQTAESVLDPALYLAPSPPLHLTSNSILPGEMWARTAEVQTETNTRESGDVEIAEKSEAARPEAVPNLEAVPKPEALLKPEASPKPEAAPKFEAAPKPEVAEKSVAAVGRMFWPRFSSPQPTLGIHIPLSFTLSGSYGKGPSGVTGAVANAYSSVTGLGKTASSGFGRSALAGSSYGTYGTGMRIYGGDNTAAWSGWGNGKWGHYGKG